MTTAVTTDALAVASEAINRARTMLEECELNEQMLRQALIHACDAMTLMAEALKGKGVGE